MPWFFLTDNEITFLAILIIIIIMTTTDYHFSCFFFHSFTFDLFHLRWPVFSGKMTFLNKSIRATEWGKTTDSWYEVKVEATQKKGVRPYIKLRLRIIANFISVGNNVISSCDIDIYHSNEICKISQQVVAILGIMNVSNVCLWHALPRNTRCIYQPKCVFTRTKHILQIYTTLTIGRIENLK